MAVAVATSRSPPRGNRGDGDEDGFLKWRRNAAHYGGHMLRGQRSQRRGGAGSRSQNASHTPPSPSRRSSPTPGGLHTGRGSVTSPLTKNKQIKMYSSGAKWLPGSTLVVVVVSSPSSPQSAMSIEKKRYINVTIKCNKYHAEPHHAQAWASLPGTRGRSSVRVGLPGRLKNPFLGFPSSSCS